MKCTIIGVLTFVVAVVCKPILFRSIFKSRFSLDGELKSEIGRNLTERSGLLNHCKHRNLCNSIFKAPVNLNENKQHASFAEESVVVEAPGSSADEGLIVPPNAVELGTFQLGGDLITCIRSGFFEQDTFCESLESFGDVILSAREDIRFKTVTASGPPVVVDPSMAIDVSGGNRPQFEREIESNHTVTSSWFGTMTSPVTITQKMVLRSLHSDGARSHDESTATNAAATAAAVVETGVVSRMMHALLPSSIWRLVGKSASSSVASEATSDSRLGSASMDRTATSGTTSDGVSAVGYHQISSKEYYPDLVCRVWWRLLQTSAPTTSTSTSTSTSSSSSNADISMQFWLEFVAPNSFFKSIIQKEVTRELKGFVADWASRIDATLKAKKKTI